MIEDIVMNHTHNDECCFCAFLPPYVVRRLAESDDETLRRVGLETIEASAVARTMRSMQVNQMQGRVPTPGLGRRRVIYDLEGQESPLPGVLKRKEGAHATGVSAIDEAYDHAGTTYDFLKKTFEWESLDGAGYPLKASVNFGFEVANAFWEGTQMVYGAGDGEFFLSFTRSLGITAHEMSHGVLSFTSKLAYYGEAGALNESFCDVIGISIEQYMAKTPVEQACWIAGGDIVGPQLADIRGIRTFLNEPAFANHAILGTDPQPKHMKDFVTDPQDNGSVHTNSGIPNHAFYLAAMAIGGNVWERATKIWFETFTKVLNTQATFAQAAAATEATARRLFGDPEGDAVAQAWADVGVTLKV